MNFLLVFSIALFSSFAMGSSDVHIVNCYYHRDLGNFTERPDKQYVRFFVKKGEGRFKPEILKVFRKIQIFYDESIQVYVDTPGRVQLIYSLDPGRVYSIDWNEHREQVDFYHIDQLERGIRVNCGGTVLRWFKPGKQR